MASPTSSLTPSDLLLLSSYLDGRLSDSARAALEERIAAEPDLRAVLDDLRETVAILRAAPVALPPRDFSLDPAVYGRSAPFWARAGLFRVLGAVGAAAAVLLIAFGVLSGGSMPATTPSAGVIALRATDTASRVTSTVASTAIPTAAPTGANFMAATEMQPGAPPITDQLAATEGAGADNAQSAVPSATAPLTATAAAMEGLPATPAVPATIGPEAMGAPAQATSIPSGVPPLPLLPPPTAAVQTTASARAAEPTQPLATPRPLPTQTRTAENEKASPTTTPPADDGFAGEGSSQISPAGRLVAVIGISLLVLSAVLFLIGWFRGRQG